MHIFPSTLFIEITIVTMIISGSMAVFFLSWYHGRKENLHSTENTRVKDILNDHEGYNTLISILNGDYQYDINSCATIPWLINSILLHHDRLKSINISLIRQVLDDLGFKQVEVKPGLFGYHISKKQ